MTLKAGVAEIDITPELGTQLAGDIGRSRPTEEIRDPLFARALILDSGEKRFCWLSLDILAMTRPWGDRLRRLVSERCLVPEDAVMVHILQNHAAPSVGHFFVFDEENPNPVLVRHPFLLGGDDCCHEMCIERALQAAEKANASMTPVNVEVGRGIDGRVAFNRRFVMRDGGARAHPGNCNPDILHCEGPADPEVGVVTFKTMAGDPLVTVLHHTCHPVHGYPQRWVTAGWPGAWCNGVRELTGGMAMVLNGFCGNIHHHNHLDPHHRDDYEDMGAKLTETTASVLERMIPVENPVLEWRAQWMKIPLRRLTDKELSEAKALIESNPEPIWKDESKDAVEWDWVYAACRLDLDRNTKLNPNFDYFVQGFRIGDVAVIAVPGEPYVEEQLRVKLESPAPFTFMAHMCNHYTGYLPTPEALKKDSFETRTSIGSRLIPEALRMMGDQSLEFLNDMYGADK